MPHQNLERSLGGLQVVGGLDFSFDHARERLARSYVGVARVPAFVASAHDGRNTVHIDHRCGVSDRWDISAPWTYLLVVSDSKSCRSGLIALSHGLGSWPDIF